MVFKVLGKCAKRALGVVLFIVSLPHQLLKRLARGLAFKPAKHAGDSKGGKHHQDNAIQVVVDTAQHHAETSAHPTPAAGGSKDAIGALGATGSISLPVAPLEAAKKLLYGFCSDIGSRRAMEDSHMCATSGIPGMRCLIGVFDGHNGPEAANLCAEKFADFFAKAVGGVEEALRTAFDSCERALHALFLNNQLGNAGTTGLVVAVGESELHVANLGDCRVVLCQNGRAVPLSQDQKPTSESEKSRIVAAGGFLDCEGYLNGEIGVSRALGDFYLEGIKKADGTGPLIAIPEVQSHVIDQDAQFLVVACDGLWDVMSNARAVDLARRVLEEGKSPEDAARTLVDEAKLASSRDNITVGVLALADLPLPPRRPVRPRFFNSRLRINTPPVLEPGSPPKKSDDQVEIVIA